MPLHGCWWVQQSLGDDADYGFSKLEQSGYALQFARLLACNASMLICYVLQASIHATNSCAMGHKAAARIFTTERMCCLSHLITQYAIALAHKVADHPAHGVLHGRTVHHRQVHQIRPSPWLRAGTLPGGCESVRGPNPNTRRHSGKVRGSSRSLAATP